MQIIPTRIHGIIDYLTAALLVATPLLLGLEGAARWVLIGAGLAALAYSLLTDYELGLLPVLSMPAHLAVDMALGLFLIASPWIFGFAGTILWPHLMFGAASLVIPTLTRRHRL